MKVTVILVGGTGRKVGKLLSGLVSLRMGKFIPDDVSGKYIDAEPIDGETISILSLVNLGTEHLFKENTETMGNFLTSENVPIEMQRLLFSASELNTEIKQGFHAKPKLAATFYDLHLMQRGDLLPPLDGSIYIVYSVFGGTGAGIGPRIVRKVLETVKTKAHKPPVNILAFAPYFAYEDPEKAKNNSLVGLNETLNIINEFKNIQNLGIGLTVLDNAPANAFPPIDVNQQNNEKDIIKARSLLIAAKIIAEDSAGEAIRNAMLMANADNADGAMTKIWGIDAVEDFNLLLNPDADKEPSKYLTYNQFTKYIFNSQIINTTISKLIKDKDLTEDGQPLCLYGSPLVSQIATMSKGKENLKQTVICFEILFSYLENYLDKVESTEDWKCVQKIKTVKGGKAIGFVRALGHCFRQSYLETRLTGNKPANSDKMVPTLSRKVSGVYIQGLNRPEDSPSVAYCEGMITPAPDIKPTIDHWFDEVPDMFVVPRKFAELCATDSRFAMHLVELLRNVTYAISLKEIRWGVGDENCYALNDRNLPLCGFHPGRGKGVWVPFWIEPGNNIVFHFQNALRNIESTRYAEAQLDKAQHPVCEEMANAAKLFQLTINDIGTPASLDIRIAGGHLIWKRDIDNVFQYIKEKAKRTPYYSLQVRRIKEEPAGQGPYDLAFYSLQGTPSWNSPEIKLITVSGGKKSESHFGERCSIHLIPAWSLPENEIVKLFFKAESEEITLQLLSKGLDA